ncbi:hypothetical protein MYP_4059 [Sporocytophaga myxococcoides]|uniref:Uncharacterized protein n=2 Tax=Sporocytophaga myxococcoides TaxID=153721 RepID=A0A098LK42_9BACT|nr:hypothetical protein MYP_4059 [Sporocytophaga myxococcoides]
MKSLFLLKSFNKNIIIILLLIINSSCEKCDKDISWTTEISLERWNFTPEPDTTNLKVYLYKTKEDYLVDQNRIIPSFNRRSYQVNDKNKTFYWVRIKQDSLNNLRSNEICTDPDKCKSVYESHGNIGGCDEYSSLQLKTNLSNTPTRLQLNIKNNGNAVDGAIVQLFYTKDDYDSDTNPLYSNSFSWQTYFGLGASDFADTTGADGTAYFDNLEPREYWFKVTKGKLNNSSTTIKTLKPLPDDPNVTTLLDIGIK